MRSMLSCLAICLILSSSSAQETKPAKDNKEATDKMISSGTVTGKLLNWAGGKKDKDKNKDKDKGKITLEVTTDVADPGTLRNLEQLQAQLNQINANPQIRLADKLNQTANINRQIQQLQAKIAKHEKHKIDFQVGDDLVVRRAELPTRTENGKIKKYTDKEKKELKGPNSKLPGYTANEDDLANDQTVMFYLSKKKEPKGTSKDKTESPPPPTVTMIVIQKETKEPSKDK